MIRATRKSSVIPEMGNRVGAGCRRKIRNSDENLSSPGADSWIWESVIGGKPCQLCLFGMWNHWFISFLKREVGWVEVISYTVIHENNFFKELIFNLDKAKIPFADFYLSLIPVFPSWSNCCHKLGMHPSRPFSVHLWTRVYP